MDEGLRAMQAEFAKAEVEHRRDCLDGDALPVAGGVDDIANAHALTADVAVVVVDEAKAAIGFGIGYRPEPIVGRGAVDEVAHSALGFDALRVDWSVLEAHRLGVGEAFVHRVRIIGAKLA
jgi:hypothetical protein